MSELTIKDRELEAIAMNIVHQIGDALYDALPKDVAHEHFVKARQATNDLAIDFAKELIDSAITEAQQDRIKRNKSFCGCPMCTHHSEPYEAQLKNNTTKQEDIK